MGFFGLLDGTGIPVGASSDEIAISGVVVEVVTGGSPQTITAAVVEVVTAGPDLAVSGAVVEVLTAEDIESVRLSGVVLEVITADNPGEIGLSGVVLEVLTANIPPPEDLVVSRYSDLTEAKLGRDLVLPGLGGTDPAPPTLTGDWPSIYGRDNLNAAVRRRLVTTPGQVVHRPEYGGGLPLFVGRLATPGERARLAAGARQNLLRDTRIGQASVNAGEAPGMPSAVLVEATVTPAGETEGESVSVLTTEG